MGLPMQPEKHHFPTYSKDIMSVFGLWRRIKSRLLYLGSKRPHIFTVVHAMFPCNGAPE